MSFTAALAETPKLYRVAIVNPKDLAFRSKNPNETRDGMYALAAAYLLNEPNHTTLVITTRYETWAANVWDCLIRMKPDIVATLEHDRIVYEPAPGDRRVLRVEVPIFLDPAALGPIAVAHELMLPRISYAEARLWASVLRLQQSRRNAPLDVHVLVHRSDLIPASRNAHRGVLGAGHEPPRARAAHLVKVRGSALVAAGIPVAVRRDHVVEPSIR